MRAGEQTQDHEPNYTAINPFGLYWRGVSISPRLVRRCNRRRASQPLSSTHLPTDTKGERRHEQQRS